ncbi:MAG: hypothetical protein Q8P07_00135, partial [bacterium]|nr:hypothetical protein [bacterium]
YFFLRYQPISWRSFFVRCRHVLFFSHTPIFSYFRAQSVLIQKGIRVVTMKPIHAHELFLRVFSAENLIGILVALVLLGAVLIVAYTIEQWLLRRKNQ